MIQGLAKIGFVLGLLASCTFGQRRRTTGTMQGVAFTSDTDGDRSVVPCHEQRSANSIDVRPCKDGLPT
jgi:hypothetical protein